MSDSMKSNILYIITIISSMYLVLFILVHTTVYPTDFSTISPLFKFLFYNMGFSLFMLIVAATTLIMSGEDDYKRKLKKESKS
jgi:hypothetical protein